MHRLSIHLHREGRTVESFVNGERVVVTAVPFHDLDGGLLSSWRDLQRCDPVFRGPFFHPGYAGAVNAVGGKVSVVVGRSESGAVVAVWPVQVTGRTVWPVGWPGADFQGPVGIHGLDPRAVLGATGADVLRFDHLISAPGVHQPGVATWRPSPFLDVAGGLQAYLGRASKTGRDNMAQARRKGRKAGAEVGEMQFTRNSPSHALLEELVILKRKQYAATGTRDYFKSQSRVRLLHHLLDVSDSDFGAVLSVVRCGDQLLAAHFGLQSGGILHWWFPVYEPTLGRFGPGWVLLRELVSAAPSMGFDRIDLGRGEDEYKRRAMTDQVFVGEGLVSQTSAALASIRLRDASRDLVRRTGAAPRLRRILRSGGHWSRT